MNEVYFTLFSLVLITSTVVKGQYGSRAGRSATLCVTKKNEELTQSRTEVPQSYTEKYN